jgi:CHAT domain-containing protein/tetratricopeptide (TPR) repeat protein
MNRIGSIRVTASLITVVVVILSGCLIFGSLYSSLDTVSPRLVLAKAVKDCRPAIPRLVGFGYARPASRCEDVNRLSLKRVTQRLEKSLTGKASASALADSAVIRLVAGRFDEAIDLLVEASSLPDARAAIWSDLGAAYGTRALRQDSSIDLVRAISATEIALHRNPNLPEALFNRAFLLEKLYLRKGAEHAWRHYLELEAAPLWRREAARHLEALGQAASPQSPKTIRERLTKAVTAGDQPGVTHIIAEAPQPSRLFLEDEIMARWAAALDSGDISTASSLGLLASSIARNLQLLTGDKLPLEAVSALAMSSGKTRRALVKGHRFYRHALADYANLKLEEAKRGFSSARSELQRGRSPFALWADLNIALCEHQLNSLVSALVRLKKLETIAQSRGYRTLHGRSAWIAGRNYIVQANPEQAKDELIRALADFEQAREPGNLAAVHSLLAGVFNYLGDDQQAWKHLCKALAVVSTYDDPNRLSLILSDSARSLARVGETEMALIMQDEVVSVERRTSDPLSIAEALWWRALIYYHAGDSTRALADIVEATIHAAKITSAIRYHLEAGLSAIEGAIFRTRDPQRAVGALSRALQYFDGKNYEFILTEILLERGRAWLALNNLEAAESDFRRGIQEYERQRRRIREAPQRVVFFDQAEAVFEDMVHLQWYLRRDAATAFAYADRSKARSLLDAIEGKHFPLSTSDAASVEDYIQTIIPSHTAVISFAVIGNQLLSWCFLDGRLTTAEKDLSLPQLKGALARLEAWNQRSLDQASFDAAASAAYSYLLGDFEPSLGKASRLVFAPDKSLLALPFAALRSRNGRYLVEDYEIFVVPSVASISGLSRRTTLSRKSASPKALVLGDSSSGNDVDANFTRLPAAEDEARQVAALYPHSKLLLKKEASYQELIANARSTDVLHLAGHAVMNQRSRNAGGILLSSGFSSGSPGFLSSVEIVSLHFVRAPLVVLSTCNSALGKTDSLEGVLDLARPFLAAGAHAVVATLWRIDDKVASEFAVAFHYSFVRSRNAGKALREAQLRFLASSNLRFRRPSTWAAYQIIGAPGRNI